MIACILAGFGCLFGQDSRIVSGVVISSDDGLAVIGAAILEKGTKNATITDVDGKFTLKVNQSAKTLEISCLGMKPKEVAITSGEMRITLGSDTEVLEGVVVTGMQKVDKRLFTGSATKSRLLTPNWMESLMSAVPLRERLPVSLFRMCQERSEQLLRSGFVARHQSMGRRSRCGLWTESSWKTSWMSTLMTCHQVTPTL